MWITISGGAKVKLSSLVKLERRGFIPILVVHERFEKHVKWIVGIITFIGIAISVVAFSKWYYSLGVSILVAGLSYFFQKALFEYTTLLSHPLPPFELDGTQWLTNAFLVPMESQKYPDDPTYVGPAFKEKEYAIKLFNYLKSWNRDGAVDTENNIVLSFVIEPDERYSTYIYSGVSGKHIEQQFKRDAERRKYDKKGKRQQQFVMQNIFWHTFPFKDGYLIKRFLEHQKPEGKFFLIPAVHKDSGQPDYLFEHGIQKFGYKLRKREELTDSDVEYLNKPIK
jgi:hypothetical protein